MPKLINHLKERRKYFFALILFMIPMMIIIMFSQMAMEIYAYNFIVRTNIERNKVQKLYESRKIDEEESVTQEKVIPVASPVISLIRPIEGGITSSYYGDTSERSSRHQGHDWAVNTGTEVMAALGGVVEKAYFSESYGYNILIRHEDGLETRYAHLSKLNVIKGQRVEQKDVIGFSGTTGASTGPHLHFEVIKNGKRVNPLKYVEEY